MRVRTLLLSSEPRNNCTAFNALKDFCLKYVKTEASDAFEPVAVRKMFAALSNGKFGQIRQQDAQELFTCLVIKLEEEQRLHGAPSVADLFQLTLVGLKRSSPSASPQLLRPEPENLPCVQVNPRVHKTPTRALESICKGEVRVTNEGEFTFYSEILSCPEVLAFHVTAFQLGEHGQEKVIPDDFVVTEQVIVQRMWMHSSTGADKEIVYDLAAVVKHSGPSTESGHYVAFVKYGETWYKCDDRKVKRVKLCDATKSDMGNTPYLIYYVERSRNFPSPSKEQPQPLLSRSSKLPATTISTPKPIGNKLLYHLYLSCVR